MTSVYSFGQGSSGQLGHGDEDDQTKPKLIIAELRNTRIVKISCGARHSAAISDNGILFTWGSNEDGGVHFLFLCCFVLIFYSFSYIQPYSLNTQTHFFI